MNGQERSQGQRRRGKDRSKEKTGSEGGNRPEPRQNRVLEKFKRELANRDFADDEVMRLSQELGESLVKSQRSSAKEETKENAKTQIRKFYTLLRAIEKGAPETFKVKLRTVQAQIAYAVARKAVSEDFKDFFDASVEKVLKSKDEQSLRSSLRHFARFFESFYAYFYYQIEIDRGPQGGKKR
ncbi:MAG TPA: type III-A CRISPR-associated protein Csm2 [Blastocatellia bacterium]|nr:type III-A CRISPR-associated protein Csm2 [Blastocatellia bacterium]